jgi:outer membrane protein assembly factor BamB
MLRRSLPLLFVALGIGISLTTLAANLPVSTPTWPQFRGPNRDGISAETGLAPSWPEGGPKRLWEVNGLGGGFASVSIAEDKIFTTGDQGEDELVMALNLADGSPAWPNPVKVSAAWSHDPNGYHGSRCTPTYDSGKLYVTGSHGDMVCLDAKTGAEVWHLNMRKDFDGKMHSGWGYSESPLVDGDLVICTPGGPEAMLVALNKNDGKEVWRTAIPDLGKRGGDGAAYSSAVIGHGAGVKQYVQLVGRGVIGVRASDGKFLWGYNPVANGVANIPSPLINGDYVFCSTSYGTGSALVKLSPEGDGVKAEEVYFLQAKQLNNHHGGMVMLGDYIYCGHGQNEGAPTCLEWKTGKIVWQEKRVPKRGSAAITYADGKLIFRYQNGRVSLIDATPEGYKEKSFFELEGVAEKKPSWPYPVICGGKLYLREQDRLMCYDVKPE